MAVTIDGKTGKNSRHFPDWTETDDKKLFARITRKAGVLIMGSKTFDTIGKPLPGRKNIVMSRDKKRVSENSNLVFTEKEPGDILSDLSKEGFSEVIIAGGATINSLFARSNLIDELIVTISPKVFGKGISLFEEDIAMDFQLVSCAKIGQDTVLIKYKVKKDK